MSFEHDLSTGRYISSGNGIEKGRFSSTIRSDDGVSLSLSDVKIHVGEYLQTREIVAKIFLSLRYYS